MLQVIERAESGAKVVHRTATTAAPYGVHKCLCMVDVAERRRFTQFENQTGRVDTRFAERLVDARNELRIAEGLR